MKNLHFNVVGVETEEWVGEREKEKREEKRGRRIFFHNPFFIFFPSVS